MLETKALSVLPEQEQNTIDLVANFGWSLKSSQEINNTDSHLEEKNGELYSVTTKEHYVKLIFERDTKMENYERIAKLEETYFEKMGKEPELKVVKINPIIAIVGIICYIVPGVLYIVIQSKRKKKANQEYEEAYAKWQKNDQSVAIKAIQEARTLI